MHASRCFRASAGDGQLGCVSCHDPHVRETEPAQRVAHYRAACLACHNEHGCSLPSAQRVKTSPQDSCIDCHMQRSSLGNIPHTAATDHSIPRVAHGPGPAIRPTRLVPFHAPAGADLSPDLERDLGIGLAQLLEGPGAKGVPVASGVVGWLEAAVARDPEDADAWEAKARILAAQGKRSQALAALETVLAKEPQRENALGLAAALAQEGNELEPALGYYRRAVAVNPWRPGYRNGLCVLLAYKKAWDELGPQCEAWLRIDPASVPARQTWLTYLAHVGRKAEARVELDRLRALRAPNLEELRALVEGGGE
jgi:hypothetical protein